MSLPWGGSYDPFSTCVVTDGETVVFQLGEGLEIGNAIADKPKVEKVLVPSFLCGEVDPALQLAQRVTPIVLRWSRCSSVNT
jgi:hypothetical protein